MLRNIVFLVLIILSFLFIFPHPSLANDFIFRDEFNSERSPNILDTIKWTIYPNSIIETRIKETGGYVQLLSGISNIFPYVVSKTNPFPTTGDFTLEFGVQYTSVVQRGIGLVVSLAPPANNINEVDKDRPEIYFFGIWQDTDKGFNVTYNGFCAFGLPCSHPGVIIYNTPSPNLSYHSIKLIYSNSVYEVYVDGTRMFVSPPTTDRPQAIWFGNPSNQYANAPWTSFKIDYIRVSGLPQPFLDLPWDYQGKGLSFNEAALSINSFFDHQYPLLSRGLDLNEPVAASANIVNYLGEIATDPYTKHDGYDYGNLASAKLGDPVLAAASGTATYINSCGSCGNMVVIDHGNGYQTRYMHLSEEGLITNIPNSPVPVENHQQIGKVGFTGNVWPPGKDGAHIHFGVFQDKNDDGNFNDNEPDGVTDPYGWQSDSPDPWENYIFDYLGQNRTGNKSNYLWKNTLANMTSIVIPNNNTTLNAGNYAVTFPQNSTNQNIIVNAKSAPVMQPSNNLISLGSTLLIKATDIAGNPITKLQSLYTIVFDFSNLDFSKIKEDTLSFYSSQDGINWIKENTFFPTQTSAQTQIDHMSYFALIGERKDTTAPTTEAILTGTEGQPLWFKSDVQLALNTQDNEGGLGVQYTLYRINEGETQEYKTPLNFTDEGHYKIEFYSVDKDDNIENVKSVEFNIDKTSPEAKIYFDDQTMKLVVIGVDDHQTTVTQENNNHDNKENEDEDKNDQPDHKISQYKITDQAGNTLKINLKDFELDKEDLSVAYSMTFDSLKYNDQDIVSLSENQYSIKYAAEKKQIKLLQEFSLKDKVKIRIRYNSKLNKSEIFTVDDEKEKLKETKDGLIILTLTTNKGNLEYSY